MSERISLSQIRPTATPGTCGQIVLVKYLNNATGQVDEIPGLVIRRGQPKAAVDKLHETVSVVAFGDGPVNAPFTGPHIISNLVLLDHFVGAPDVEMQVYGPIPGFRVWAQWMEFQTKKHAEATPVAVN